MPLDTPAAGLETVQEAPSRWAKDQYDASLNDPWSSFPEDDATAKTEDSAAAVAGVLAALTVDAKRRRPSHETTPAKDANKENVPPRNFSPDSVLDVAAALRGGGGDDVAAPLRGGDVPPPRPARDPISLSSSLSAALRGGDAISLSSLSSDDSPPTTPRARPVGPKASQTCLGSCAVCGRPER